MTRPALPRLVEQTRLLMLTQMWLVLVGILLFMLLLRALSARGPLDEESSNDLAVLLGTLLAAPVLLAVSAKLFRNGWAVGWVFALLAELNVAFLLYAAIAFGFFLGIGVAVLAALAVWVIVNLFRAEVRRFSFGRGRATVADRA